MSTERPLSIAEVTELPDDAWVNGGFTCTVREITEKKASRTNKPFWVCKLADTTGSATVECSLFMRPKFREGDQVDFLGQGIKFNNGQYGPKVKVSDKTEIHVVGRSVHHEEQKERAQTGAPAINGQAQPIAGQAVGCAMNQAIETHRYIYTPAELREMLKTPAVYWDSVWEMASDQLRIARLLENGKLKPSIKERTAATAKARTAPTNEREAANLSERDPEDVPF